MKEPHANYFNTIRTIVILLFAGFSVCAFFYPGTQAETSGQGLAVSFRSDLEAKPTPPKRRSAKPAPTPEKKYAKFSHDVEAHKIECSSCHKFPSSNWKQVRKGDEAFPDITDYPRHESCLSCHREQFFKGSPPSICSICHTNPSADDSSRHAFPNPREIFDATPKGRSAETAFQISFPHDKHIEIVSENFNREENQTDVRFVNAGYRRMAGEESCAVCHKTYQPQGSSDDEFFTKPPAKLGDAFWLKKGTFKTVPIGHTQCFTCHSADSGLSPAPTDCATCHKLKPLTETKTDFDPKVAAPMQITDKIVLHAWRKRDSSATFRHEFSSHAEMECATCHNAAAMNTLDPLTKKVKVGSCAPCHITATVDDGGILNYEIDARKKDAKFQCVKCHIAYGKSPIPESHTKVIADAQ